MVVRSPVEEVAKRTQKNPLNAAFFHFFSSSLSIRPFLGIGTEEILEGGEGKREREREGGGGESFFAVSHFRFSLPIFPPETPNVQVTSHPTI